VRGLAAALLTFATLAAAPSAAVAAESSTPEMRLRAADALARQGELRRAQGLLEEALAGVGGDGAPAATRAPVLARLGRVLGELGDRDRAAELLGQAADAAREAGLEEVRGEALNDLGNALLDDDPAAAVEAYDESGAVAAGRGLTGLAARCAINAARAELRRDEPDAAAGRLALARQALAGLRPGEQGTLERLAAAGVAVELARQDPARLEVAYRAAAAAREAAARSGDPRDLSWAEGYLGELYALQGRTAEALALYRQAALRAEAARAPEVLFRWQWLAGRALAALGRRDEAIAAYRSAARNLDLVRLDLPAFDPRTGRSLFRETLGPVFVELADLLLQRAEASPAEAGQVDLVEVRATVERLKTVELEDYFRDDCAADLTSRARPSTGRAPARPCSTRCC
jgi:tetratricopeptide (TPR) repeat protein